MSHKPKCFIRVSPGRPMGDDTKYHHCVDPSRMVTYRITLERIGPYLDYEVIHYDDYSRNQALRCGFVDDETLSVLLCPHLVKAAFPSASTISIRLEGVALAASILVGLAWAKPGCGESAGCQWGAWSSSCGGLAPSGWRMYWTCYPALYIGG